MFCGAIGMVINNDKSTIYFPKVDDGIRQGVVSLFNFTSVELCDGIKYIGFSLKPNNYSVSYWKWIFSRMERKIDFSCNRWDSKLAIDWMNEEVEIINLGLQQIMNQLHEISALFNHFKFYHIRRDINIIVDDLSKDALLLSVEYFFLEEFSDGGLLSRRDGVLSGF